MIELSVREADALRRVLSYAVREVSGPHSHQTIEDFQIADDIRSRLQEPKGDSSVDHPAHYGGIDNPYEAIKVIEAWDLSFCLGNTVKYIARAGLKPGADFKEDLKKARWYLDREIAKMEVD